MKKVWFIITEMGGAKEIGFVVFISFFGPRPRFFYYLSILTLITGMVSYMKIAYHQPRPYMIEPGIHPISCSKAFGQPSGHSMAASLIAITLVLDVFHGSNGHTFYSKPFYYSCVAFAVFWATAIPYTRFLMGVHSLDQIVYGSTLGVWAGFTMHFLVRDHLMEHLEMIINHPKTAHIKSLFFVYTFYILASIMTFLKVDSILTPDSEQVKSYQANFAAGGCGVLKPLDSL